MKWATITSKQLQANDELRKEKKKRRKWPYLVAGGLLVLPIFYLFAHAASFTSGSFTFTGTIPGNTPWTNNTWTSVSTDSGVENITTVGNSSAPTLEVQDPQVNGNFSSGSYLFTQATNFGGTGNTAYIDSTNYLGNHNNTDSFTEKNTSANTTISIGWYPLSDVYTLDGWYVANTQSWYTGPVPLTAIPVPTVSGLTTEDANSGQTSGSYLSVSPGDTLNVIFDTNGNTVYQHLGNASWGSVAGNGGVVAMLTSSSGQNYNLTNAGSLSVPVYGYNGLSNWYNGYSASSLGSSDSGAVTGTIPSNASGQYTLNVYYVDGIGRVGDESMQINVQAAQAPPPAQAPTLTLATPNTSVTTGTNVPLTANASSLAANEGITIHDMSSDNTIGGANASTGGTGVNPYTTNATSQTAEIVTYEAGMDWVNPSTGQTQVIDSNQINVAYTAPTAGTLSLTANPQSLNVGSPSAVSANYNGTMPSNSAVYIHDISGDNTLNGTNVYEGNIGSSSASTNATDSKAQTVELEAAMQLPNGSYIHSSPVYVTWNAASTCSAAVASFSGGSLGTYGTVQIKNLTTDNLTLSTTTSGASVSPSGDPAGASETVTIYGVSGDTSFNVTTTDPTTGCSTPYTFTATTTQPTGPSSTTSLSLVANPTSLAVGSPTTLTVTIPPDSSGLVKAQEFVNVYDQTTGQYIGAGAATGTYAINNGSNVGIVTYPQTYTSNTAGPQTFVAQLWDAGVTPWNNPPSLTSNTATVTWQAPTITMSANPAQVFAGEPSQLSYSTVGFASGDYVVVNGTGGSDMWSATNDPNATDNYSETEFPTNGGTTTVQYVAKMYGSNGSLLATSNTATVTWQAPTITMSANPQNNVPGQPSTISYSVNKPLPSGMTVSIIPSGNGSNMWSASGLTAQTGTDQETENPQAGGPITVNYIGEVINNSTGQIMATGTTSVSWTNPWLGSITLSASPQIVPTGSPTTLTATTTQAVPSGWNLVIYDQTTGQMVGTSAAAPETAQYTSFAAETDTFIAYLNDGYENVGNPSNTVQVVWSQLALSANPTQLPSGQSTTLTVAGQNVPSGDYLVIYNESTGQTVGYSLSTPYSVQTSESTPQTDNFVAYISSNSGTSGALIASNVIPVDWYGVMLTAHPQMLPTGSTSTLTANAQNMPSGYELDIVDQTTGQIIASGQPGETTLTTTQTKSQVETDQYVAQVVQPGDPTIPNLPMPSGTVTNKTLTSSDVTFRTNASGTIVDSSSQASGTFYECTPANTWVSLSAGQYGEHYYNAGQNIAKVSFNLADNMYGVNNGAFYSYPYIKAYNSSGTQIGIYNIPVNFNGTDYQFLSWSPPAGTTALAFGWIQNNGYNYADNWTAEWSNVQVALGGFSAGNQVWFSGGPHGYGYYDQTTGSFVENPGSGTFYFGSTGITALVNVPNYHLYAGGANGIAYYDESTSSWVSAGLPAGIPQTGVTAMAYDSATNTIWEANSYGVCYYGISAPHSEGIIGVPGNSTVYALSYDSQDQVMYVLTSSGVMYWNGSSLVSVGSPVSGATFMTYDASLNEIIVGSSSNAELGISHGLSSTWTYAYTDQGGATESLGVDSSGNIYNGAYNNYILFQLTHGATTANPTSMSNATGDIQAIAVDNSGVVWFGTANGAVGYYNPSNGQTGLESGTMVSGINAAAFVPYKSTTVQYFPYWNFNSMPSYVPASLFPYPSYPAGEGYGFWSETSMSDPNGTVFFESTFNLSTSEQVTLSVPTPPDDFESVYIDGTQVIDTGYSATGFGYSNGSTTSATVTLSAGMHQVIVEGVNTNGFTGASGNPARADLQVTDQSGNVLVANSPSSWMNTGYMTQLPPDWFSGAIGNWAWTEYVMQESTSQPIYESQAYSLSTPAASVAATSTSVDVTWYQWQVGLTASPTQLPAGQASTLTVSSAEMPSDGYLTITNEQNQTIYTGPMGQAYDTTTVTSSVAATHTYTAHIIENGGDLQDSNVVSVTWVATAPPFLNTPQISGLLSDPGTPQYMWLPIPESQYENGVGPGKFWWPLFEKHGWNTDEQGGPNATQKIATVQVHSLATGQPMSVGIYSAQARYQDPLVWARPASAFALRMVWHGPAGDWPTGGTATWTETNPDGELVQWTAPIRVYPATQVPGATHDAEAINTFTGLLPRLVYPGGMISNQNAEPVAWGLGNTNLEASSEGAHISVELNLQDTNGLTYTQTVNDVAILYGLPTWYLVWSR